MFLLYGNTPTHGKAPRQAGGHLAPDNLSSGGGGDGGKKRAVLSVAAVGAFLAMALCASSPPSAATFRPASAEAEEASAGPPHTDGYCKANNRFKTKKQNKTRLGHTH